MLSLDGNTGSPYGATFKRNKLSLKRNQEQEPVAAESQCNGDGNGNFESDAAGMSMTDYSEDYYQPPPVAGLYNLGNTCYLNSVMQVLRHTPGFTFFIERQAKNMKSTFIDQHGDMAYKYEYLSPAMQVVRSLDTSFFRMEQAENDYKDGQTYSLAIRPYRFLEAIRMANCAFEGGEQEDAHELLCVILVQIQESVLEMNEQRIVLKRELLELLQRKTVRASAIPWFQHLVEAGGQDVEDVLEDGKSPVGQDGHAQRSSSSESGIFSGDGVEDEQLAGSKHPLVMEEEFPAKRPRMKEEATDDWCPLDMACESSISEDCMSVTPLPPEVQLDGVVDTATPTRYSLRLKSKGRKSGSSLPLGNVTSKHSPNKEDCYTDATRRVRINKPNVLNGLQTLEEHGDGSGSEKENLDDHSPVDGSQEARSKLNGLSNGHAVNGEVGRNGSVDPRTAFSFCGKLCSRSSTLEAENGEAENEDVASKPVEKVVPEQKTSNDVKKFVERFSAAGIKPTSGGVKRVGLSRPAGKNTSGGKGAQPEKASDVIMECDDENDQSSTHGSPTGSASKLSSLLSDGSPKNLSNGSSASYLNGTTSNLLNDPLSPLTNISNGLPEPFSAGLWENIAKPNSSASKLSSTASQAANFTWIRGDPLLSPQDANKASERLPTSKPLSAIPSRLKKDVFPEQNSSLHASERTYGKRPRYAPNTKLKLNNGGFRQSSLFSFLGSSAPRNVTTAEIHREAIDNQGDFTGDVSETAQNGCFKEESSSARQTTRKVLQANVKSLKKVPKARKSIRTKRHSNSDLGIDTARAAIVNKEDEPSPLRNACPLEAKVHLTRLPNSIYKQFCPWSPNSRPWKLAEVEDRITNMFQGEMAHRTQCCECENYTERKETFMDLQVPIRKCIDDVGSSGACAPGYVSDEEDESEAPHTWILNALQEVEKLRDDEKYYCEKCGRKVEAQRSTHYTKVPQILVLQLKRFAMGSLLEGGLVKVNDFAPTPLEIPCFKEGCKEPCTHSLDLYAIVAHAGTSISQGHYIAYVKVRPNSEAAPVQPPSSQYYGSGYYPIQNAFPSTDMGFYSLGQDASDPNNNADPNNNLDDDNMNLGYNGYGLTTSEYGVVDDGGSYNGYYGYQHPVEHWLECDDDMVKEMTRQEMLNKLSSSSNLGNYGATPYMLFYSRRE